MVNVKITCPSCKKDGILDVSEHLIKNISRGLLAINIQKTLCNHSFIIYIDKNFAIRDYFIADYQLELPEIISVEKEIEIKAISADLLNLNKVKNHLPGILLSLILRCIFFNQKIVVLSNEIFYYNHGNNFFKFITKDTFNFDITFMTPEDYEKNSKSYKDYIVFNEINIIQNTNKKINQKEIDFEKSIVNKFLAEQDLYTSIIFLKNDIQKIYELTKVVVEYLKNLNREKQQSKDLIKFLNEHYKFKIPQQFLNYLLDIAEYYYQIEIPKRLRVTFF